ncbi:MAG: hypothetical protein LBP34_06070 [Flavobacteriaceae bacterium]|nr:hypothetical protein [Flavobacteriaceae bacterium]
MSSLSSSVPHKNTAIRQPLKYTKKNILSFEEEYHRLLTENGMDIYERYFLED